MSDSKAERSDRWSVYSPMTKEFEEGYDKIFGKKETWFERRERERKELLEKPSTAEYWLNHKHQTGCEHTWEYVGHGHNSSTYKCSKCGIEDDY